MGKTCKYTLVNENNEIIDGVNDFGIKQLDEYLINTSNYNKILKTLNIKDSKFYTYNKSGSVEDRINLLSTLHDEAKKNLDEVRKEALAEYLKSELADDEKIEKYSDDYTSVLNWIATAKGNLANKLNLDDYKAAMFAEKKRIDGNKEDDKINEEIKLVTDNWEYSRRLGKALHYVANGILIDDYKHGVRDVSSIRENFNRSVNLHGNSTDTTLIGVPDSALQKYINIIYDLKKQLSGQTIMVDYHIQDDTLKVRGKIDILAIDSKGKVTIYDLKASFLDFDEWRNRDKGNFVKYQTEMYKRLLNKKGIPYTDISVNIIPIKMVRNDVNIEIDDQGAILNSDNLITDIASGGNVLESGNTQRSIFRHIPMGAPEIMKLEAADPYLKYNKEVTDLPDMTTEVGGNLFKYFNSRSVIANDEHTINLDIDDEVKRTRKDANGNYVFYNSLTSSNEIYKDEESLREGIRSNLLSNNKLIKSELQSRTDSLHNILSNKNLDRNNPFKDFAKVGNNSNKTRDYIEVILNKYVIEAGWKILDRDDLLDMGVIVLMNDATKTIDLLSLTQSSPNKRYKLTKGSTILGGLLPDSYSEQSENKLPASKGNIEAIKLLDIFGKINANLDNEYKIGDITVTDLKGNTAYKPYSLEKLIYNYNILRSKTGLDRVPIKEVDPLERFYTSYTNIINLPKTSAAELSRLSSLQELKSNFNFNSELLSSELRIEKLRELKKLWSEINSTFFKDEKFDPNRGVISYLMYMVSRTIINLEGIAIDAYNNDKIAE